MASNRFESRWLYGLHDPGGESLMLEARKPGWIVYSAAIGHEPGNQAGVDFRPLSDRGVGVICRLTHGHFPHGTLPHSSQYANFARRCASFVASSPGCHIWIVGNEPNAALARPQGGAVVMPERARTRAAQQALLIEAAQARRGWWVRLVDWVKRLFRRGTARVVPAEAEPLPAAYPAPEADDPLRRGAPERFNALYGIYGEEAGHTAAGEVITPALYGKCYHLCRSAIRQTPGHETDLVLVAAVAPWNSQTTYPGNARGDWVQYFVDILRIVQDTGCDGFALHTFAHGSNPAQIAGDTHMQPPFADRRIGFRVYQDFLAAVPDGMRHLPVYITETDQVEPWADVNSGWVQRAYAEIDRWNRQPGTQKLRALALYRWSRADRWYLESKSGVIADFQLALAHDYRWDDTVEEAAPLRAGDRAAVKGYASLRRAAGYLNKADDDLVHTLTPGTQITLLDDAPQVLDGLVWWHIGVVDAPEIQGWLAQFGPDGAPLLERVETPEPAVAATAAPGPEPASAAPAAFKVGDRVRTTTIVNGRRTPGLTNKPADDVVREIPRGTPLVILDGPEHRDGLVWWLVRWKLDGMPGEGWVAQRLATGEALLEKMPAKTAPPPRYRPGDRAMTVNFVRLRRSPGYMNKAADDVIAEIWQGTAVVFTSGPRVVDDLTWWEVETSDTQGRKVRGWMAETAPGGIPLLGPWVEADRTPFKVGELATLGAVGVRVRRSPGYRGKGDDDVLGEFLPKSTLYLAGGPVTADDLRWWRVSGVLQVGEVLGWVAESAPNGGPLLRRAPRLPGTSIPDLAGRKFLGRPFAGTFGISQLWGENAAFYARYSYEGVALWGHNGVDFLTPSGTPVLATEAGEVAQAGFEPGGFGNYVLLRHAWGESVYAHLEAIAVQPGQAVGRGEIIGRSGNTGGSTGPHLHVAIRINPYARTDGWGGYSDPLPYLDPKAVVWPPYMLETSALSTAGGPAPVTERRPPSRMAEDAPGLIRP
ncbi:MAG: M23 family metallopeptidase [Caldilineaceae bacterium]|nr:M23 family metallopeptidase [Caldilineaceae bacterium]